MMAQTCTHINTHTLLPLFSLLFISVWAAPGPCVHLSDVDKALWVFLAVILPSATCSPLHQNHRHQNGEGSINFPCWEMMSSARDVSWGTIADGMMVHQLLLGLKMPLLISLYGFKCGTFFKSHVYVQKLSRKHLPAYFNKIKKDIAMGKNEY